MRYIISDRLYQVLKWACALVLPALATMVGTVAPAWGADGQATQAVVTTITAVATFGGVVLGVSAATARGDEDEGDR